MGSCFQAGCWLGHIYRSASDVMPPRLAALFFPPLFARYKTPRPRPEGQERANLSAHQWRPLPRAVPSTSFLSVGGSRELVRRAGPCSGARYSPADTLSRGRRRTFDASWPGMRAYRTGKRLFTTSSSPRASAGQPPLRGFSAGWCLRAGYLAAR